MKSTTLSVTFYDDISFTTVWAHTDYKNMHYHLRIWFETNVFRRDCRNLSSKNEILKNFLFVIMLRVRRGCWARKWLPHPLWPSRKLSRRRSWILCSRSVRVTLESVRISSLLVTLVDSWNGRGTSAFSARNVFSKRDSRFHHQSTNSTTPWTDRQVDNYLWYLHYDYVMPTRIGSVFSKKTWDSFSGMLSALGWVRQITYTLYLLLIWTVALQEIFQMMRQNNQ